MKNFKRKFKKSNLIVPVKKSSVKQPRIHTIWEAVGSETFWNRVQTNYTAGLENSLKKILSDSAERVVQISIREMVEAAAYKFPKEVNK